MPLVILMHKSYFLKYTPHTLCRMLDIQAKKYESEEAASSPRKTSSSSSKSETLTQLSEGTGRSSLYGSELIKKSLTLKAAKFKAKGMQSLNHVY